MTSTTTGHSGFRHELFLYRSAEDLLEFVVSLVRDGMAAEEPTLLLLRADTAQAVVRQIGPSPYLMVEPALAPSYARVVHQQPVISHRQWPEWRRLEAVMNLALRDHDTWAVCAYDERDLTADMVEDLHATHPLIGQGHEHRRSDRYQHPVTFLVRHGEDPPDPIERTPPAVELIDPSPATARATVKWFSRQWLPDQEIDKLIFATHEAILNALRHGRPPIVLRLWAQPGRVTVTVTDAGSGPTDPLVGLLPPEPRTATADDNVTGPALGLWLIHQLVDVTRRRDPGGYTIRLTAASPNIHPR
jgi:anti-sigma regulatory factor (Ser/Thr protein kinase)